MKWSRYVGLGLAVALAAGVADQLTKTWAHAWVGARGPIDLLPGLNIVAWNNTGTAFGIGQGTSLWVLIGIALAISAWLLWLLSRAVKPAEAIGLGLVIGGALGNVLDRIRLGSVRDFIDVYWRSLHWPAFNLADVAIVCGLSLFLFFHKDADRPRQHATDPVRGPE